MRFTSMAASCVVMLACGEVPSTPDAQLAVCEASQALRCDGSTLVSCNADGTAEEQRPCNVRCDPVARACEDSVDPSNGFAAELDAAGSEPALEITQETTVDTTGDFNATKQLLKVGDQLVAATLVAGTNGAPDVVVISVSSFSIAAGVTLTTTPGPRALAIMSAGDVTIAGVLEARAGGTDGSDPCVGASQPAVDGNDYPGGGGGGFGTPGASGGAITPAALGGAGGDATGTPTLIPLRGGCRGGNDPANGIGFGGHGGGGLQITSSTRIEVAGAINAPGLPGEGSAGGGAGGGILLEAPSVTVTGGLFANGGGGGCGYEQPTAGQPGQLSTTPASGGICAAGSVRGGNGGAGTTPPTEGSSIAQSAGTEYAGGGGGAVGRIRINTVDMTVEGNGTQSPAASVGPIAGR